MAHEQPDFEPWNELRAISENDDSTVILYNDYDDEQKLVTTQSSGNRTTEYIGGEVVHEYNTGERVTLYPDGGMRIVITDGTIIDLPTIVDVEKFFTVPNEAPGTGDAA